MSPQGEENKQRFTVLFIPFLMAVHRRCVPNLLLFYERKGVVVLYRLWGKIWNIEKTCCGNGIQTLKHMEGKVMKKLMMVCFVAIFGLFMASGALAVDEAAIAANVDAVVAGIDGGKAPTDYKADEFDPYVYIMEEGGMLLVHPSLQGQSLGEEKYKPVYEAIIQATAEGVWVEYEWGGAMKKAYVKKTQGGLIVGSGY